MNMVDCTSYTAGLFDLLCGLGNFCKIWSSCSQHAIQHTAWRMDQCTYNFM